MARRLSLGLDIGVSSVGFSVLDHQSGQVLELGSRLFNASVSAENETRRSQRGNRRLLRRKRQRRIDVVKLFAEFGLIDLPANQNLEDIYYLPFDQNANPYELRVQGLTEQLTKTELATALYQLVKHRGISFDLEDWESSSDYAQSLKVNEKDLTEQTPAQIQLKRFRDLGQVRAQIHYHEDDQEQVLLNVFPTADFLSEAQKIIATQRQFYPEILTDEFEAKYCAILKRKREYFKGPGSEKSRTDYGVFKENGETVDNLFEELIGHDDVYPDELRASAASYTAQIYNVLNDLNNLTIVSYEDGKMPQEGKQEVIDRLKAATGNIATIKVIKQVAKCEDSDIRGYRTNEKDKPDLHSLAIYRKMHKDFLKDNIDITTWPADFIDDLSFIMTLNTEDGEIRRQLQQRLQPKYDLLTDDLIQIIIDHKEAFKITTNNKWHRFSLKTMRQLIPDLLARSVEQMTLLHEMGLVKKEQHRFQNDKYLPYQRITEDIYNPVAAKAVREALKITNAVLKKYGHLDYIVIEMPRDDNEKDKKKQIEKFQKENKKTKDKALVSFIEAVGSKASVDQAFRRQGTKLYDMIRFWYEQDGRCFYSGKKIDPDDLLTKPGEFEIDHIIPQSISFDDSLNNKTLCFKDMNQGKEKKTPYEFLNEGKGQGWDTYKAQVMADKKIGKLKRANYLFMGDVSDVEVRKRFISRNLVDTRYASRVVLNSLQEFFNEKAINKNQSQTQVTVIRGKFTSNMRKHWHLTKSRETDHHHAIDASIIAATPFLKLWKNGGSIFPVKVSENLIDIETVEVLTNTEYSKNLLDLPYSHFVTDLFKIEDRVQFSRQVDKKMNRRISNDTLYSVRDGQLVKDKQTTPYIIAKIKDIYSVDGYQALKKICEKDPTKLLIAQNDPQSFKKIQAVMDEYCDKIEKTDQSGQIKMVPISPFELYRREHGYLTKYAKHNNGPIIKQLKYYDKKVGIHIDVTPRNVKNKQVILQSLNPWRTDVYYNQETDEYQIMGIKHSDLDEIAGERGIRKGKYLQIKEYEQISPQTQFVFSLYKNDRIKVQDPETGEQIELLFRSRNNSNRNYAEFKLIESFDVLEDRNLPIYGNVKKGKQIIKRFAPKGCKVWKVNTDILGNPYYLSREGAAPKNILD
ncbi:type II CRISPR RNA-guided endonuclease Cas9 [Bombilactobacillus folatiphilus]|uniref:CRISPR-associated endonuclease Cas9 n=1 Tax=Bombilactobacillus folatiphilus TaxID=2923362 RepID=A0ABY4PAQ5_9LACO|nr:type II CRISPR RNA-guided endonuclease Cas9 [Bombilactobacillus folatiphilus]UQS82621.1 type II CRISPR RNA-guided endonuclease Cas9 [Bombilactobacillus folatiphilus]